MPLYYAILWRALITMLTKSHFFLGCNAFTVPHTWDGHAAPTHPNTNTCSKTGSKMLNIRLAVLNHIRLRWYVIYSSHTLTRTWKYTPDVLYTPSRGEWVCVLNGFCLLVSGNEPVISHLSKVIPPSSLVHFFLPFFVSNARFTLHFPPCIS